MNVFLWIVRLIVAGILLQTLFFKFMGAKESVWIFTTLGIEPWGRIGSGIMELIASVLILIPRTTAIGAVLAAGLMTGALLAHLTRLGIPVENDGGLLFALAVIAFLGSVTMAVLRRKDLPVVGAMLP